MANKFDITISATDKATATVKKVNDAMGKITRPFEEAHKSFKQFDAALADNPIAKSLGHISKASLGATRAIGRIAAPIAAITGIGSIAGITMLADRWAKFGRATTYAAQGIGISTTKLQQYQGMATLAGLSTESMVSGLGALGTTMEDARWGRNQGALMMLNRLGIGLKKTKDGAFDVNAEFIAVAKVMTSSKLKNNPWAQQLVASELGMTSLLPLLRQGEEGLKRYQAQQDKYGYKSSPLDIQHATEFANSLSIMKIASEGLGQSIMDKAMPALKPFIDDLSSWISKNRKLISDDVSGWVKTIADAIGKVDWKKAGDGMTAFFTNANSAGTELKTTLDGISATVTGVSNTFHNLQYFGRKGGAFDEWLGIGRFTNADRAQYAADHSDDPDYKARQQQLLREGAVMSLGAFTQKSGWIERLLPASGIKADYQDYLDNLTAKTFTDPTSYTPRGVRNNNPGNLNWARQVGAVNEVGPGARFAVFKSPSAGISALAQQLQLYGSRGNDTLAGIVNTFSPAGDGNDTSAYIAALTGSTGYKPDQHLNLSDPAVVGPLVTGIIQHENGSDPYTKSMESDAVNAGLGVKGPYTTGAAGAAAKGNAVHVEVSLKNAPPGTTAKSTATGAATTAPPRIGYSAVGAGA